jgi:hypothetical protein
MLRIFNFHPNTVNFFKSYLSNRAQSVHTQHAKSRTQIITHGIPQGSTLSTTFFLLYINDIIKTVKDSTVYTYADDTTLIITAETRNSLQATAQAELTNLIQYFHANNLVPNPTKTNYTIFSKSPASTPKIELKVNSKTIEETEQAKLLGMIIQGNFKFHQHITTIVKKLQPLIQSFRYANKLLPTAIMKQLYFTHVYPHLIYAISIWGTNNEKSSYLQPLIRTRRKSSDSSKTHHQEHTPDQS